MLQFVDSLFSMLLSPAFPLSVITHSCYCLVIKIVCLNLTIGA